MSKRHELLFQRMSKLAEKTIRDPNEKEASKSRDSGQRTEASRHNREEETKLQKTDEEMESLRLDEAGGGAVAVAVAAVVDDEREKPKKNGTDTKVGIFDVGKYFKDKKIKERELTRKKYKGLPPKCKVCGCRGVRNERECHNYDKHYLLEKK
ncbi:hypothetical protein TSAR_003848 [Trichomalopsis sarcophagae]|uniref:Uncharacterized protein n=1 Tax=Trichomalopsis sarcophagae TaxID=543379 RepID=A0A232FMU7_9HYME|nr:hypothetical protein TSAR_003848 [Trichomalopsis sarcophagae]